MWTERRRYGKIGRVIVEVVAGEGVENCDDWDEEDEKPTMLVGAPRDLGWMEDDLVGWEA